MDNTQKLLTHNKNVNFDASKIACKFIVTKKINNDIYGKYCNNLCNNGNICDEHLGKTEKPYNLMAINLCQHIITQKSGNLNRKGMFCGNYTFDSPDTKYCKDHISRHNDNTNTCLRSFKVRCYPNKDQRHKLNIYFGATRYTYNKCITNNEVLVFSELRDKYVTNLSKEEDFLRFTPKEIRAFAVKEYITNKNNSDDSYNKALNFEFWKRINWENYTNKTIKIPVMNYRKKKNEQCLTINKDSVYIENKEIKIYKSMFSSEPLKLQNKSKRDKRLQKILNGVLYHDIKIIRTNTDRYYICFTDDVKKEEMCDINKNACCIDPGVRTLLTVYSEDKVIEIGENMNEKIGKLIKRRNEKKEIYKEEIKLRKVKMNDKDYNNAKKEYRDLNEKIKNMIDDIHYKAITKLTEYKSIYIPKLNSKKILEKNTLSKQSKQLLQVESHGKFIRRLKDKSEEKGVRVEIVTEKMTTKTCSNCFELNNPNSSKIYECLNCNIKIDRDINASKNIYLQLLANIISKIFKI